MITSTIFYFYNYSSVDMQDTKKDSKDSKETKKDKGASGKGSDKAVAEEE